MSKEKSETSTAIARLRTEILFATAVLTVYAATAVWGSGQNMDAVAAGLPAWSLAERGTLDLSDYAGTNPWIVPAGEVWTSNRPPGVWLPAVPLYGAASPFTDEFLYWPSTLTAVLIATAVVVLLRRLLTRILPVTSAYVGALAVAFGTATWYISGRQLWPHGTAQLLMIAAMLAAVTQHGTSSNGLMAASILVRPPLALVGGTVAILRSLYERSIRTLAEAWPLAVGLAALLIYNRLLFGDWNLRGGYSHAFVQRAVESSWQDAGVRVLQMFLSPRNGLLIWSPFLIPLLPGLLTAWRQSPPWIRSFALAGLSYLVVHAILNRVSGGLVYGYRYQLTPLMLWAPLLAMAYSHWVAHRPLWKKTFVLLLGLSIVLQALNVFALTCVEVSAELVRCGFLLS